jgi:hypothetical protein
MASRARIPDPIAANPPNVSSTEREPPPPDVALRAGVEFLELMKNERAPAAITTGTMATPIQPRKAMPIRIETVRATTIPPAHRTRLLVGCLRDCCF